MRAGVAVRSPRHRRRGAQIPQKSLTPRAGAPTLVLRLRRDASPFRARLLLFAAVALPKIASHLSDQSRAFINRPTATGAWRSNIDSIGRAGHHSIKHKYGFHMQVYKRNQVEEAIARTMGHHPNAPAAELLTRSKRLLDADRAKGCTKRSDDPERSNYAFYSDKSPGKGVEVNFTDYEAFALQTGTRMLDHGWPQGFVVSTLRRVRPDLEAAHRRILRNEARSLSVIREQYSGSLVPTRSDPEFLLIVSDPATGQQNSAKPYARLFRDQEAAFQFQLERPGRSCTWLELVSPAVALHRQLQQIEPRKRGRSS